MQIRHDPELSHYFDVSTAKYPSKKYMLDVRRRYIQVLNTIRSGIVQEIVQKSNAYKKKQKAVPAEVMVTDEVWEFLKKTDHFVPGKVEKRAAFVKKGKKPVKRK